MMDRIVDLARKQAAEDLAIARETIFWDGAVTWLRNEMPHDLKVMLRGFIIAEPESWIGPYHFTWGMAVRNRLRDAGFGEVPFGIQNLDNIYVQLVEEAVRERE